MVYANIGAEWTPIVVIGDCPIFGDIAVLDSLLRNMDITEEISSAGGWKSTQDTSNCTNE